MKIAVAYDAGSIFLHFGHCPMFAIYTSNEEETEIVTKKLVELSVAGHQAVADAMAKLDVDAVICGNIGSAARMALAEHGIIAYAGFEGGADSAADMLIEGRLPYIPDAGSCGHHGGGCCGHHDHDHEEGGCCGHHEEHHHHDEDCGCGHHEEHHHDHEEGGCCCHHH